MFELDEARFKTWADRHVSPHDGFSMEDTLSEWIGERYKGTATLSDGLGDTVICRVDVEEKDDEDQDDAFEQPVPAWVAALYHGSQSVNQYMGWQ